MGRVALHPERSVDGQGAAAMNMVLNPVLDAAPDELTTSMVEVDAAAARAALADHLHLAGGSGESGGGGARGGGGRRLAAPDRRVGGGGIATGTGRVPAPAPLVTVHVRRLGRIGRTSAGSTRRFR